MHVCCAKEKGSSSYKLEEGEEGMICPRCGSEHQVFVHGHTQCGFCHLVVEECCQGEVCEVLPTPPSPDGEAAADELP